MKISVEHIGHGREPVIVIDGFVDAQALIDDAATQAFAVESPYYPGLRAKAPRELLKARGRVLAQVTSQVFGARALTPTGWDYSLVTAAPEDLEPIQRLPHFDGPTLALLVYLGAGGQGGTAFYRQRATDIERVDPDSFKTYEAQLRADVEVHGPGEGYRTESDAMFEKHAEFDPVPGRALLYRGMNLHSGVISAPELLCENAATGRLTLNGFFKVE